MYRFMIDGSTHDDDGAPIVLEAHGRGARWNGWERPHVTRAQLAAWLAVAGWDGELIDDGETLCYVTTWREDDIWPRVGTAPDGAPLYALDGWTWDLFHACPLHPRWDAEWCEECRA